MTGSTVAALGASGLVELGIRIADVPVDPDAPTARDWLRRVLAGAEYQQAKPSLGDIIGDAIVRWLEQLRLPVAPGGPPAILIVIPIVLVAAAIVTALVVYGVPRMRRRRESAGDVFGADDTRTATAIRRDAAAAARAGDWSRAVIEQFRAITRALDDRTVISVSPGTTALGVARRAGTVFPDAAPELRACAETFDRVRYLGDGGTRADWDRLVALDGELERARPHLEASPLLAGSAHGAAGPDGAPR